jgi:hypothetical protein
MGVMPVSIVGKSGKGTGTVEVDRDGGVRGSCTTLLSRLVPTRRVLVGARSTTKLVRVT